MMSSDIVRADAMSHLCAMSLALCRNNPDMLRNEKLELARMKADAQQEPKMLRVLDHYSDVVDGKLRELGLDVPSLLGQD